MTDDDLLGVDAMERVLRTARSIAVLGIKPESRRRLDAHQIPLYLQRVGYAIWPVPVRYPEVTHILGVAVVRRLTDLAPVDILNVFCKPADLRPHLTDIVTSRPGVVWFQSGLRDRDDARLLTEAGLPIAEDCIGCRRASVAPAWGRLEGQAGP